MDSKRVLSNLLVLLISLLLLSSCGNQEPTSTATPEESEPISSETAVPTATEEPPPENPTIEPTITVETAEIEPLYTLDWKLAENEIIAYKTAMEPGENTSGSLSFNFDQIFADNDAASDLRDQLSNITFPDTYSLISILQENPAGNISIKMIFDEVEQAEIETENSIENTFNQMFSDMEGTVQLRGELTPEGTIASFYLEQRQRNLVAMFFELPATPVHVGDSWEIDVNCVSLGHGFIASSANRVNEVVLSSVGENEEGQSVAILEYVIVETVEGEFQLPFSEESTPTSMSCSFLGQGSFLIEEGRWEQFVGEFRVQATGMLETNIVQQFALEPLDEIPQEYIDIK